MIIATLVSLLVALLVMGIGVLLGIRRGYFKSVVHLISLAVSLPLAMLLAVLLRSLAGAPLLSLAKKLLSDTDYTALLENEANGEVLTALFSVVIAPIIFLILFAVIALLLKIAEAAICKKHKETSPNTNRLAGAALGFASSLVVLVAVFGSVIGLTGTARQALDAASEVAGKKAASFASAKEVLAAAEDNAVSVTFNAIGGKLIYNLTTSVKYDGKSGSLSSEIDCFSAAANLAGALSAETSEWGTKQTDSMKAAADSLDKSVLISTLLANVLSDASVSWNAGDAYCGIEKPELNKTIAPALDVLMKTYKECSKEQISENLNTLSTAFKLLVDNDVFTVLASKDSGISEISAVFANQDMTDGLIEALQGDSTLKVLVPEIYNTILRAAADISGVPETKAEAYKLMMQKLTDALNSNNGENGTTRAFYLADDLNKIFTDYGVTFLPYECINIAVGMVYDFNDYKTVTPDQIIKWFAVYAESSDEENSLKNNLLDEKSGVMFLSGSIDELSFSGARFSRSRNVALLKSYKINIESKGIAFTVSYFSDNTIAVKKPNGEILKGSTARTFLSENGFFFEFDSDNQAILRTKLPDYDINQAVEDKDAGAELLKSKLENDDLAAVVLNSPAFQPGLNIINNNIPMYSDGNGPGEQSISSIINLALDSQIAQTMAASAPLTSSLINLSDNSGSAINISTLGSMQIPTTDGDDTVANDVKAFTTYISKAQDIMKADSTAEEKETAIKGILDYITPNNANAFSAVISYDMLVKFGMPEKYAVASADLLKGLFANLAKSDPAYAKTEAASITTLFRLMLNESGKETHSENFFGADGMLGMTASELVDQIQASAIITDTLNSYFFVDMTNMILTRNNLTDPFGLAGKMTEADETQLSAAVGSTDAKTRRIIEAFFTKITG